MLNNKNKQTKYIKFKFLTNIIKPTQQQQKLFLKLFIKIHFENNKTNKNTTVFVSIN